jgi:hypothetical protein
VLSDEYAQPYPQYLWIKTGAELLVLHGRQTALRVLNFFRRRSRIFLKFFALPNPQSQAKVSAFFI